MVVPLPGPEEVLLERPSAEEAQATAIGLASASAHPDGLSDIQRVLLEATCSALTDHAIDLSAFEPVTAHEFAEQLARRNLAFRTRVVQMMVLAALVLRPLPPEVTDRIAGFARELGVDEGMIAVAQRFAAGSLGLAAVDFERNGYTRDWATTDHHELHTSRELARAWDDAVADPDLAERWAALEALPEGTLGRGVWQMYTARGFVFPGLPGSAPPLLAQHDWVHVLGDYGTTVESELEVFALIARANDDMRAFSLLAMVVSLFETGYLARGAGLFQSDVGHISGLSKGREMAIRIGDAMTRGAWCRDTVGDAPDVDFLRIDWFDLASLPLAEARARFALRPRSPLATEAGAVGPWEPGGISPYQLRSGRARASEVGRAYESYGAEPPPA
jgi:hypothetical protein